MEVVVGGAREESVVDVHLAPGYAVFLCHGCGTGGLGDGVGHIEDGGDASVGGCAALCLHVCFMGEPRVAKMDVGVYHSGNNETAFGVDDGVEGEGVLYGVRAGDVCYDIVFDDDVGVALLTFVDDGAACYQYLAHWRVIVLAVPFGWGWVLSPSV